MHEAVQQILYLSLPSKHVVDETLDAEMDFWSATSLNSENIHDYNFEEEVNKKNNSEWTPLMYAAYLGHRELCQLLILKGAKVEEVNERNQTALMLAASCGAVDVVRKYYHAVVVQLLLERGADPNLADYNESTPVLAACENGDEKILSYLLDYKGNPNRRNKQGLDAYALATDEKLQALLRRYKQEMEPALREALFQLDLQKYVKNLMEHGIKTMESLLKLTEKDLDDMGIGLLGPKRKLTNYIKETREKCALPKTSTQSTSSNRQIPSNIQLQQKCDELSKLLMDQRRELVEQKRVNAQCRQTLTQLLTNGRCTACTDRTPRKGSIEELIRELDRMNARLGSFLL
uniref:NAD(+) ADP-ribosyltransferase n=1 Tax=Meloidogyne javanica TaxID=6303 RepID=A0A915LYH1_MELJA